MMDGNIYLKKLYNRGNSTKGNIILLTLGMSGHQLGVTGGYYFSHTGLWQFFTSEFVQNL